MSEITNELIKSDYFSTEFDQWINGCIEDKQFLRELMDCITDEVEEMCDECPDRYRDCRDREPRINEGYL